MKDLRATLMRFPGALVPLRSSLGGRCAGPLREEDSRHGRARHRDVRGGVQPDQRDHLEAPGGRQRQGRVPRRQERPADRRPGRHREPRHDVARLAHRRQRGRHRRPRAPDRREGVLDPVPRGREGQHPHLDRGQPRDPGRDLRRAELARPGAPAGEEGLGRAQRRVRPHHEQGREGARGGRSRLRDRSPRSPTTTSTACSASRAPIER